MMLSVLVAAKRSTTAEPTHDRSDTMVRSPAGNDAAIIVKEIDITASASVVWKALTEQNHLVNWLPVEESVKPGKGGSMRLSWGEPVIEESSIELWEPEKHLRLKEI